MNPGSIDIQSLLVRLSEIGIALSSEQDLHKLLNQIVLEARCFCNAEAGSLYLREPQGLRFVVAQNDAIDRRAGQRDRTSSLFSASLIPFTESSLAGYVGVTGKTLNIIDAYEIDSSLPFRFNPTRSMLLVPMSAPDGQVIGVLQLINARDGSGASVSFDERFSNLVRSLASQAAVAVRNAQLARQLKDAYRDTVVALSVAAEFRDRDTAAHILRMSHYCGVIARKLGLPEAEVELILLASPMHDVGKLGVPDAILQKPGKLTDDEFREMQRHTIYGERILSISDAEILRISREIAASHHEKWDGTGYPHGLQGPEIPLNGRIAAVADVFDALCSRRCYKEPMPFDQAVALLVEQRGRHFDPTIVDAFIAGIDDVSHFMEIYADDKLTIGRL
jgi:hypothetical protein